MAVQWSRYHVGYSRRHKSLFIGCMSKDNKCLTAMSEDRTHEIILAVMQKMKSRMEAQNNTDKPYYGYRNPEDGGTLLYIDEGYTFSIRPKPRTSKKRS